MRTHRGWPLPGGRLPPARLWFVILPLATGAGLVGYVVAGVSLRLGIALVVAVGLGLAALVLHRTPAGERAAVWRRVGVGLVGGALATAAYDGCRFAVVSTLGLRFWPFDIFPIFGQLLAGDSAPPAVRLAAGVAYHWANGLGFGVAYLFLFHRPRLLTGVLWAAVLELAMISIYPSWLHLRALSEFLSVSLIGHAAYGSVLGLVSSRLLGRAPGGTGVAAR
jgi:hypothetical protein